MLPLTSSYLLCCGVYLVVAATEQLSTHQQRRQLQQQRSDHVNIVAAGRVCFVCLRIAVRTVSAMRVCVFD